MTSLRRPAWTFLFAILVLSAAPPGLAGRSAAKGPAIPELDQLLSRMARVAELYRDNVLSFTCNETISYSGRDASGLYRFAYIYRFSEEDQLLEDYRIPRGRLADASAARQERLALEGYGFPEYVLRAYSWIFVFREEVQPSFRFTIEGTEKCQGRAAIRVRFEAIPPFKDESNAWVGTALVDRETYQLLHVEAIRASEYDRYLMLRKMREERRDSGASNYRGTYTYSTYTTEFDVVRNGLRLPGRVMITRTEYELRGGPERGAVLEHPAYKVIQTYKRYRFFSVRTAEEIRRLVFVEE